MNSDLQTFQQVVKHHQVFSSKGIIQGLEQQKIKKLIDEYTQINSTNVDEKQVLSVSIEDEQKVQKLLQKFFSQNQQIIIQNKNRKRKNTFSYSQNKKKETQTQKNYRQSNKKLQSNKENVHYLKKINRNLLTQSKKMNQQIKEVKNKMDIINKQQVETQILLQMLENMEAVAQKQKLRFLKIQKLYSQELGTQPEDQIKKNQQTQLLTNQFTL